MRTIRENEAKAASPLEEFSNCHGGIIENFEQLRTLITLTNAAADDPRPRKIARQLITFFHQVVVVHHAEEEQELFTAVTDCRTNQADAALAENHIKRLLAEHRELESMWQRLEPDIKRLAKGMPAKLDTASAEKLATQYLAHAKFEEQHFLPLAAKILSKNDLSALGLSLHMRHQQTATNYYI